MPHRGPRHVYAVPAAAASGSGPGARVWCASLPERPAASERSRRTRPPLLLGGGRGRARVTARATGCSYQPAPPRPPVLRRAAAVQSVSPARRGLAERPGSADRRGVALLAPPAVARGGALALGSRCALLVALRASCGAALSWRLSARRGAGRLAQLGSAWRGSLVDARVRSVGSAFGARWPLAAWHVQGAPWTSSSASA